MPKANVIGTDSMLHKQNTLVVKDSNPKTEKYSRGWQVYLFCLIQKHTLKNNNTNNHTTLPEPWPFRKCVVYCSSSCDDCLLLYTLNGVFAILKLCLEFTKCHIWAGMSPTLIPTLPYQRESSHSHARGSFILCLHHNILQSLKISQTAWANSCCYCAPQSCILPFTWYFHTFLPPTSRLNKRDERWGRQFPLVLFSSCCYTQHHKLGSSTQHKCIILRLWSSSSEISFTRPMSRGQRVPSLEAPRGESFLTFSASSGLLYSLARSHFFLFKNM